MSFISTVYAGDKAEVCGVVKSFSRDKFEDGRHFPNKIIFDDGRSIVNIDINTDVVGIGAVIAGSLKICFKEDGSSYSISSVSK